MKRFTSSSPSVAAFVGTPPLKNEHGVRTHFLNRHGHGARRGATTHSSLSLVVDPPSSIFLAESSGSVVDAVPTATTTVPAATTVFEPIMPSTETLLGMGFIVSMCVLVAWVWQTQVVPTSRTNLALSKRSGPVKEYLDELKQATAAAAEVSSISNEGQETLILASTTNSTETALLEKDGTNHEEIATTIVERESSSEEAKSSSRALERWLFTDWLQDNKSAAQRKPGRQKEPALPILKDAKWNSGDNPVLAATLLISVGVLFTAVTERAATSLSFLSSP